LFFRITTLFFRITALLFWAVAPCRLMGRYKRFRDILSLALKMETEFSSEALMSV
jgi:hypothetical protein